jgi:hypothetical protein
MVGSRAALGALLGVILTACSPGAQPTPSSAVVTDPTSAPAVAEATTDPVAPSPTTSPSPMATPKPTPTPVTVPPKPSGVTFGVSAREIKHGDDYELTYTVTWRKPRTNDVEIRVYGVLGCLSMPDDMPYNSSGPCLVKGTTLPKGALKLIGTAKASEHVVSWKARSSWGGCDIAEYFLGPNKESYSAIVLAAYNPAGHSVFAIAEPGEWWMGGPEDMPC